MVFWRKGAAPQDETRELEHAFFGAMDRTQAIIRFTTDGTILHANDNFLGALGYQADEIIGQHHPMFVDPSYAESADYVQFWHDLAGGKAYTDQFPRLRKDGSVIWIQATYAPVHDDEGNTTGVIKIATDITTRQDVIGAIADSLHQMSQGNLTADPSHPAMPDFPDLAAIARNVAEAQAQLSNSIGGVQDTAIAVEETSAQVGAAAADLSKRTESQAATLEETAAALEELTATVRNTADNAKGMEQSTSTATGMAERAGNVAGDAITAMGQIEDSSGKIAQIISVIDDIAFQTNLLALNAGVEAARAGEAGRGFAVVASEVRALAQRASEAAGEIKALITESSGHVSTGVDLVGKAGDELQQIIKLVADIAASTSEIARGAGEQAIALTEINTGVAQLDAVTQQNAAMVEETNAASATLSSDASRLAQSAGAFQISRGGGGAQARFAAE